MKEVIVMKKVAIKMFSLAAAAIFLVSLINIASAAETARSKDLSKLNAEITMLNADAKLPQADKIISKQLMDNFDVKSDKISSLVGRNMQYGDIAAILAFADKMPGGLTDANINQVLSMRQSRTGWAQIAKSLNVDISDVTGKLSSIEEDAHTGIKQALAEAPAAGAGGGPMEEGMTDQEMPGGATGGTDSGTYGGTDSGAGGMSGGSGGGSY